MVVFIDDLSPLLNFVETISIIESFIWILGNFRTQITIKGDITMKFSSLLTYYKRNGLYLDICGIAPFNIIIANSVANKKYIILKACLRVIRTLSSWRAIQLFGKAEVAFKNNKFNIIMQILKAFFYIFFLGHFLACLWYFVVENVEDGSEPTWIDYHKLD